MVPVDRAARQGLAEGVGVPAVVGAALGVAVLDVGGPAVSAFDDVVGLEAVAGAAAAVGVGTAPVSGSEAVGLVLGEQVSGPAETQGHPLGVEEVAADLSGEDGQHEGVDGDEVAVVVLTEVLLAGVRGFLLKSDARSHLIAAIEALLDHRPYFTSVLLEKLLHDYLANRKDKSEVLLSSREQSVVQLIAEGHTNKSVGAVLNLSVKTVETHRASAMRKLNISSTAELVRYAIRTKLVGL